MSYREVTHERTRRNSITQFAWKSLTKIHDRLTGSYTFLLKGLIKNPFMMPDIRGQWPDCIKLIGKQQ